LHCQCLWHCEAATYLHVHLMNCIPWCVDYSVKEKLWSPNTTFHITKHQ
jgi:hypothetical protein